MKWFTSDWHFNDVEILRYCGRPFKSTDEMNKFFIMEVNRKCKNGDDLYILGDLSITSGVIELKQIFSNIKVKINKHLILGNHDNLKIDEYRELGFASIATDRRVDLHFNKDVVLVHDPASCQKNKCYVCGHVHGLFDSLYSKTNGSMVINVSPEANGYCMVNEKQLDKIFNDLKTLEY